ncbi:MAG: hypothetical protein HKN03_07930 [Acidimicrobiales bacterium]|nr:hypothetical protein [Acidimicrobiales bacterium]
MDNSRIARLVSYSPNADAPEIWATWRYTNRPDLNPIRPCQPSTSNMSITLHFNESRDDDTASNSPTKPGKSMPAKTA